MIARPTRLFSLTLSCALAVTSGFALFSQLAYAELPANQQLNSETEAYLGATGALGIFGITNDDKVADAQATLSAHADYSTLNPTDMAKAEAFGSYFCAYVANPEEYGTQEWRHLASFEGKSVSAEVEAAALNSLADAFDRDIRPGFIKIDTVLERFKEVGPAPTNKTPEVEAARLRLLGTVLSVIEKLGKPAHVNSFGTTTLVYDSTQKYGDAESEYVFNTLNDFLAYVVGKRETHSTGVLEQLAMCETVDKALVNITSTPEAAAIQFLLTNTYGIDITSTDPQVVTAAAKLTARYIENIAHQPEMHSILAQFLKAYLGKYFTGKSEQITVKGVADISKVPGRQMFINLNNISQLPELGRLYTISLTNTATGESRTSIEKDIYSRFVPKGNYSYSLSSPTGMKFNGKDSLTGEIVVGDGENSVNVDVSLDTSSSTYTSYLASLAPHEASAAEYELMDDEEYKLQVAMALQSFGDSSLGLRPSQEFRATSPLALKTLLSSYGRQPELLELFAASYNVIYGVEKPTSTVSNSTYLEALGSMLDGSARQPALVQSLTEVFELHTKGLNFSNADKNAALASVLADLTTAEMKQPEMAPFLYEAYSSYFEGIKATAEQKAEAVAKLLNNSAKLEVRYREALTHGQLDNYKTILNTNPTIAPLTPLSEEELQDHQVQLIEARAFKDALATNDGLFIFKYFFGNYVPAAPLAIVAPQQVSAVVKQADSRDASGNYRGYTLTINEISATLPETADQALAPIALKASLSNAEGKAAALNATDSMTLKVKLTDALIAAAQAGRLKVMVGGQLLSDFTLDGANLSFVAPLDSDIVIYAEKAPAAVDTARKASLPRTADTNVVGLATLLCISAAISIYFAAALKRKSK